MTIRTAVLALALSIMSTAACATVAGWPTVQVTQGLVQGSAGDDVEVYRGIPYAAPPVGDLRWRAPAAYPAWQGVRASREFGPACPQPRVPPPFGVEGAQSEDCLTLNIWRPAGAATGPLPVMVWIHGGAFVLGSGSQPLYDGASLARRGAVVVSMNYRLGALGFLSHRSVRDSQPGEPFTNFGILDQIAALQWVQRNIAAFGGDPGNVTIAGESAGGVAVHALMTSDAARGLFHKAIAQSGGGLAAFLDPRNPAIAAAGDIWSAAAGAPGGDAAALRALPVERIVAVPFIAFPSIDGWLLTRNPAEAFQQGEQAAVPYLSGANSWEGSLPVLPDALAAASLGPDYAGLLERYTAKAGDPEAGRAQLRGDLFFVEPGRFLAQRHYARGLPSWLYHFEMVPASDRAKIPGAPHGGELAYLFGTPACALTQWDERDRKLSELMQEYWLRFMRTGDPNGGSAPVWKPTGADGHELRLGEALAVAAPTQLQQEMQAAALSAAARGWKTPPGKPGSR